MTAVSRFVAKAGAFVVDACLYVAVRWMWRLRMAEKAQRRTDNERTR